MYKRLLIPLGRGSDSSGFYKIFPGRRPGKVMRFTTGNVKFPLPKMIDFLYILNVDLKKSRAAQYRIFVSTKKVDFLCKSIATRRGREIVG